MRKLFFMIAVLCMVSINSQVLDIDREIEDYLENSEENIARELKKFTSKHLRFLSDHDENIKCSKRPNKKYGEPFGFIPILTGKIYKIGDKITFENECFIKNEIIMTNYSETSSTITLEINSSEKKHYLCKHAFFISTTNLFKIKVLFLPGTHKVILKNLKSDDFDEIRVNGIKIFEFCHDFISIIFDVLKTKKMFDGQEYPQLRSIRNSPDDTENLNKEFLEDYGFVFIPRNHSYVEIDTKLIHDGDLLTSFALDAGHTLIMFGTGGRTGHSAITMWIDDELFVFEGSVRWADWIKKKLNKGEYVTYNPLRKDLRLKFNKNRVLEFYNTIDEHPYGMKNFIFSWFDTPDGNTPNDFPSEVFPIFLSILEKFKPDTAFTLAGEGLLLRLGIIGKNLTIPQITAEASRRGMTIEELMALPEKESFVYSTGPQYVCSSLVAKLWLEGGIFGDVQIESQEFSPRDIYELNIFETDITKIPQVCRDENPELKYCMVNGKYKILLPNYNTITPYDHMNEKCPSASPVYYRPPKC